MYSYPHWRFYKKINEKRHCFGKIAGGWQASLEKYQQQRDDLYVGRPSRAVRDGLRLHEPVNRYLDAKERMQQGGEPQQRSRRDSFAACQELIAFFGRERRVNDLAADDFGRFRLSRVKARLEPVAIDNEACRTRGLFTSGFDNGVIAQVPRYGAGFRRPSVRTLRLEKAKKPARLFSAEEVRRMLQAAPPARPQEHSPGPRLAGPRPLDRGTRQKTGNGGQPATTLKRTTMALLRRTMPPKARASYGSGQTHEIQR